MSIQTMQSFGSQEWDAGFAVQALLATNLIEEIGPALAKGHDFIKKSQVYIYALMSQS
jgi:beta-amyrin synthase